MLKFKVSPSVTAAAVPTGTGFGAFAGKNRHCIAYAPSKTNKKALRCVKFMPRGGKPSCPDSAKAGGYKLVDAGRSPHLVRSGPCPGSRAADSVAGRVAAARKPAKKPAKKPARRSRR